MQARLEAQKVSPAAYQAMLGLLEGARQTLAYGWNV
jgi:hypothetical protein